MNKKWTRILTAVLAICALMISEFLLIMECLEPYRYGDRGVAMYIFGMCYEYHAELLPGKYNALAQVIEVDDFVNLTTAITEDGQLWDFYAEDLEVGSEIDLIMYDMGTYEIYDDLVIDYIH